MDARAQKQVKTTTAARALVDALLREGVDHVFGIPGTQNLAVLDALRDTPQIRFILTRHEQGAAFMADVYGLLTGKASVAMATLGPGAATLLTGIAGAYRDLMLAQRLEPKFKAATVELSRYRLRR